MASIRLTSRIRMSVRSPSNRWCSMESPPSELLGFGRFLRKEGAWWRPGNNTSVTGTFSPRGALNEKLLSASRPLGVINPWLRVVSGELHHHSDLLLYHKSTNAQNQTADRHWHDLPSGGPCCEV